MCIFMDKFFSYTLRCFKQTFNKKTNLYNFLTFSLTSLSSHKREVRIQILHRKLHIRLAVYTSIQILVGNLQLAHLVRIY